MKGQTNWDHLAKTTDFEGLEDEEFEVDWSKAEIAPALPKEALSIRLDQDIVDFFRAGGPGYQTRMNAVLRAYIQAKQRKP